MKIIQGFEAARRELTRAPDADFKDVPPALKRRLEEMFGVGDPEQVVRGIIDAVRRRGDEAILELALMIDRVKLTALEVTEAQKDAALAKIAPELRSALELAADRVREFHAVQKEQMLRESRSEGLGYMVRSLERVGLYVPGGTASYPSTVLMTAIPARVAGVKEIVLCTPPGRDGAVPAITLAAARIAGVDRVFAVGGAQAIAAMAYGTKTVPRVDKICGPGNMFVVLAKKLVFGAVAIDGLQGPSEVVIIADGSARPGYCAADLLAQAEHDAMASAILVTDSPELAAAVEHEVTERLARLSRREITSASIENNGKIVVVRDLDEAVTLANLYAPEHLYIIAKNAEALLAKVSNAGCVFLGPQSPVVLGDYVAGPSHVLPTGGTARFASPLNVLDFVKLINTVSLTDTGELARAAAVIAKAEGLEAHALAAEERLKD